MPKNPSESLLKIGQAAKLLGVSIDTLRRWEKTGKISTIRTPGGTRLYSLESLKKVNPKKTIEIDQVKPQTTSELLKKTENTPTESLPKYQSFKELFTNEQT